MAAAKHTNKVVRSPAGRSCSPPAEANWRSGYN
jgi:hypothetical protein